MTARPSDSLYELIDNALESMELNGMHDDPAYRPLKDRLAALAPVTPAGGELIALLPGTYYMDPPDGGDVPVIEQLRRMAKDAERWRARAQPAASGYYLASFKQKANGGEVLWWGSNNAGYTPDLEQAGVYTEIIPGYHDMDYTVPVPVAFIDSLRVRRVVDPGDSLNGAFWSAEKLRAALAPTEKQS